MRKEFEEQQRKGPLGALGVGGAGAGATAGAGTPAAGGGGGGGNNAVNALQGFDLAAWMAGSSSSSTSSRNTPAATTTTTIAGDPKNAVRSSGRDNANQASSQKGGSGKEGRNRRRG